MRAETIEFIRFEAHDAVIHVERWAWWAIRDIELGDMEALVESNREVRRGLTDLLASLADLEKAMA